MAKGHVIDGIPEVGVSESFLRATPESPLRPPLAPLVLRSRRLTTLSWPLISCRDLIILSPSPCAQHYTTGRKWNEIGVTCKFTDSSQVPLVVADSVQGFTKTRQAVEFLRRNKAWADVAKVRPCRLYILILQLFL